MISDERDYKIEISGLSPSGSDMEPSASLRRSANERSMGRRHLGHEQSASLSRPYLCVHFACCNIYQRVYRDRDGMSYTARCPKCGRSMQFPVGHEGTGQRFFVVK